MIGIGQENDRFDRALQDEFLRKRLIAEYGQKIKAYGWAAVLQVALAFMLGLMPRSQQVHYVFLLVALGFLIICLRLRCDLNRLKLADQRPPDRHPNA